MKYQTNSTDLKTELDDFLDSINAADDYKDEYRKVYERQYKDLKYKINKTSKPLNFFIPSSF